MTAETEPKPQTSPKPESRKARRRSTQRRIRNERITWAACVIGAVAAAFAPASLTGDPFVDAIERVIFAAIITYATGHGHRWTWLVASAIVIVPSGGVSLYLALAGGFLSLYAMTRKLRPKHVGAIVGALLSNACLWYPNHMPILVIAGCAVVGSGLVLVSGFRAMQPKPRRRTRIPLLVAGAIIAIGLVGVIVGGLITAADLTAGTTDARNALSAVENGDTNAARKSLGSAQSHLDRAHRILRPATLVSRLVPSLAQHVKAVDVSLTESRRITDAADDLLETADYENLRYDGRIDIDQLRELGPGAVRVRDVLADAQLHLAKAKESWLVSPLDDRLGELATQVAEVHDETDLASDVLEVAPAVFGGDGDRRYLIAFLTPAELRGGGGFIGSYAEMSIIDGRMRLSRSGPIRDLILHGSFGTRTLTGPEEYLRRYGRFDTADYIQDVPYSPHFPYNAQALHELYPQAGGTEVDGVIAIDPAGLAALLELPGPVDVDGFDEKLSSENAEEFLLREQYIAFTDDAPTDSSSNEVRKDFLAEATKATFEALTKASLPAPAEIGKVLGPAARGRHLQVWSPDETEQALLERVHADSSLVIPEGSDGFEVVQHNAANNKIDAYLERELDYRVRVDTATGRILSTLKITLHNNVPSTDLPLTVTGNRAGVAKGTNVTWLSIFSPHDLIGSTIDGKRVDLGRETEVDLNAYDTPFIEIAPGGTVVVELKFLGDVDLSSGYSLTIMPQPVANPDRLTLRTIPVAGAFAGPDTQRGAVAYQGPITEPLELNADITD